MNALTSARWLNERKHCCVRILRAALAGIFMLAGVNAFAQSTVTTLANTVGYAGAGTASATPVLTTSAKFKFPAGIALDPSGTSLFLADCTNNVVRWVSNLGNKASSYTYNAYIATNGISHPIAIAIDSNTNIYVLNRGTGKNGNVLEFNGS
jgi:DNA-binding beta-propeller fold protein YncE